MIGTLHFLFVLILAAHGASYTFITLDVYLRVDRLFDSLDALTIHVCFSKKLSSLSCACTT